MKELSAADRIAKCVKNDPSAMAFILAVHAIVELWDDLIDKDKPATDGTINDAFYAALITLPRNGFYQQNFALLNPVLESAILDWLAANKLEARKDGDDLKRAYTMRCGILALTVMAARIVGGVEWASQVNVEIRSLGDSFAEYAAKHGDA